MWYNPRMNSTEMTREEFFAALSNLDAEVIEEFWEDGYTVEEVRDYLAWREEARSKGLNV